MSRTIKQLLQRRRESIFGIFPSLGRGGPRWKVARTDTLDYIQLVGRVKQKPKYSGYLAGNQGGPSGTQCSLHHQGHSGCWAFHFVFESKRGDIARFPSFNKNHWDLWWLNFYIQHYPLITTWQWSSVNPFLTSGQPFLRIMQFRSKSC